MSSPKYQTVGEYLAAQDPAKAQTLRCIIDTILAEFPALEAKIAWNIPTLHCQGKYVAGLAAYQRHLTFSPWSAQVMAAFKDRLAGFVTFKNCFQIPVNWKVDTALVKDMVRARLAELR